MNSAGGWNKTHGQVEKAARVDSFELAQTETWSRVLCAGKWAETYHDNDLCVLFPPGFPEIEIKLSHKRNGYGGQQTFFLCPGCGGRFRYLYLTSAGVRCRSCAKLNYKSQQQTRDSMADYSKGMDYAEKHLAPAPFPIDGFGFLRYTPDRPSGMHEATYRRHLIHFYRYRSRYSGRLLADLAQLLRT